MADVREGGDRFAVPPMIGRSQAAFRRNLPKLLQRHYRQWVAYHGEERVAIGATETELYEICRRRGLEPDQFVVRSVEPETADEVEAFLDV